MLSKLTMSIQDYARLINRPNFEVPKSSTEEDKRSTITIYKPYFILKTWKERKSFKKDTKRIDEKGTNTLHLSCCLSGLKRKILVEMHLYFFQVKLTENSTSKGPEFFIASTKESLQIYHYQKNC